VNCEFVFWNFIGTFPISTISRLDEPYKAEPLRPLCVCEREREICKCKKFSFAWEGEIVWGVEDKFCEVLRGSGFDNCGLDLYGVLLAAIQSLGTYHTHCVDSSSVPFRCLVYEVTEYHRFLK
jgi:hypothetical protein